MKSEKDSKHNKNDNKWHQVIKSIGQNVGKLENDLTALGTNWEVL